jgi:hypothetical protein
MSLGRGERVDHFYRTVQYRTILDEALRCWTMLDYMLDYAGLYAGLYAGQGSTSSGLTEQQVALLNSRAITEITPGQWMHTREQADGRIVLTPVDPRMELQMIEGQTRGDAIVVAL